jgi:hypothetical protein
MKDKNLILMTAIANWCFTNNSKTFTCFFDYSAHVDNFNVRLYSGGWGDNCEKTLDLTFLDSNRSIKTLASTIDSMNKFKLEHDEFFSKNAIHERRELKKKEKIARIKRQLALLEA